MIQSRLVNKFYHLRIKEEWRKLKRKGGAGRGGGGGGLSNYLSPEKGGEVLIREGA